MNEQREKRWKAVLHYRSESGTLNKECVLEEIEELHHVVELGPHWDTIYSINITKLRGSGNCLTIEQALEILSRTYRVLRKLFPIQSQSVFRPESVGSHL